MNVEFAKIEKDATSIWQSGVDAVRSDALVANNVACTDETLSLLGHSFRWDEVGRICVVGGGKAGAGMARGLEAALTPCWLQKVDGLLNVPADCVQSLQRIELHAARPAGSNEPTLDGLHGTQRMVNLVSDLTEADLCLCLISGGGSALMPLPVEGISLEDKLQVTRQLSAAGASIHELNAVRKRISRFKGGGLAEACQAGQLISLILSDVMGDPLDVIASGPTVADAERIDPLQVLEQFDVEDDLKRKIREVILASNSHGQPTCRVDNHILGNNQTAVDAAAKSAIQLGYRVKIIPSESSDTTAEEVGLSLLHQLQQENELPACLISGGEPVVELAASSIRGKGGRNQQLVLAALQQLLSGGKVEKLRNMTLLSGGTDGEDGPTNAAGAMIGPTLCDFLSRENVTSVQDYLDRNDAYTFFESAGTLLQTGPTHTNVCDLRIGILV